MPAYYTANFIGLTKLAKNFVEELTPIPSGNSVAGGYPLQTFILGAWKTRTGTLFIEVVQDTPWSRGPVIFTNLRIIYRTGLSGPDCLCWVRDPRIRNSFDPETGLYWV